MSNTTESTTPKAPTTCGEFVTRFPERAARPEADGGARVVTCHRLPMHKGECRATLRQPSAKPSAKGKGKGKALRGFSPEAVQALVQAIADGSMSASDALDAVAQALKGGRTKATHKPEAPAEAPAPEAKPLVWGCNARSRSGVTGKVVRLTSDRVTLRTKDGDKVYVRNGVVRI